MVAGYPFYKAALLGLRHCALGMDLLVVTATTIAYIYSVTVVILDSVIHLDYDNFFDSIPLLLMFISFGRLLEHIAKVCVQGNTYNSGIVAISIFIHHCLYRL